MISKSLGGSGTFPFGCHQSSNAVLRADYELWFHIPRYLSAWNYLGYVVATISSRSSTWRLVKFDYLADGAMRRIGRGALHREKEKLEENVGDPKGHLY